MIDQKQQENPVEEVELMVAEIAIPPSREEVLKDSFPDLKSASEEDAASYLSSTTVPKGGE